MNNHATHASLSLSRRTALAGFGAGALGLALNAHGVGAFAQTASPAATPFDSPVEFLWESIGDADHPLGYPTHLAVAPDGHIWVADGDNNRFLIFAPDGTIVEEWGTTGSAEGEFDFTTLGWGEYNAGAIAFAPDGSFYVADVGNYRVQKFGPDRQFLTAWGSEASKVSDERSPGQFSTMIDLVVDGQDRVYVLDSFRNNYRAEPGTGGVQVFDADGQFLAEWGETGEEPGQLLGPFGIGLDPDGTILIAEVDNDRVQRFTPEGELLDVWGAYGSADGEFINAMDAAVDAKGYVFVTDYMNQRVQVFDRGGQFLTKWGEPGNDPGKFSNTLGVAIGTDGVVYVTDESKRLQAFRILPLPKPAATPSA